ncbi:DUF1573 domain-containing protein [Paraflavitalea pollutisoli]|uniref:DUF1573 domain-containing protein n=1 Tax=Paraflavitalea pollutisoli TaxID=3034143 RepID=UPI0023EA8BEC|nr:DUF1573 domain-containing protein [Paraflavitalea sp. H1-2-19X]
MKKLMFLALAIGVVAVACQSSASENKAAQPKPGELTTIQWVDTLKEMGQVTEGQVIDISYRFKNAGTKPLVIEQVNVSCGCTVAEKPEKPIAPGEEGIIKASFNSTGKPGPNSKSIYVVANTEGSKEHRLQFMVDVKPAAEKK